MGTGTLVPLAPRAAQRAVMSESSLAQKFAIVDVTLSASYATGGDTVDFTTLGLIGTRGIALVLAAPTNAGYVAWFDQTNKKVKMFQQSAATGALTEVPAATNLSAVVVRCVVFHA